MNSTYDVVVIGGGPAGIVGATTAAALGAKVALVDSWLYPAPNPASSTV